jgi:hypothetical protein
MILFNSMLSFVVLNIVFKLFGISQVLPVFAAHHAWAAEAADWEMFGTLVPGAAIGFGLLWFWLILIGRKGTGVSWGGSVIYGVIIGLLNVPFSGLLTGLLHGSPILGLLIGLVIILLVPAIGLCMALFGLIMGVINGRFAQNWIDRRYAGKGV